MPIRAHLDADRRLLLERGQGRLGREDFLAHFGVLGALDLAPGLQVLGDYEEASIELSLADVAAVGYRARQVFSAIVPVVTALAARGDLSFGVARMVASRAGGEGFDMRVFRDVSTARAWLDEQLASHR